MTKLKVPNPWAFARENRIGITVTSESLEFITDGLGSHVTMRWHQEREIVHSRIWRGIAECLLRRQGRLYTDVEAIELASNLGGAA